MNSSSRRVRRTLGAIAALAVATAVNLGATPSAFAVSNDCTNVTYSGTTGILCINSNHGSPTGYQATYKQVTGSTIKFLDFNLRCADGFWTGDAGSWNSALGVTRSYVFAIGANLHPRCRVELLTGGTHVVLATTAYVDWA